jgi:hypothetical protein
MAIEWGQGRFVFDFVVVLVALILVLKCIIDECEREIEDNDEEAAYARPVARFK